MNLPNIDSITLSLGINPAAFKTEFFGNSLDYIKPFKVTGIQCISTSNGPATITRDGLTYSIPTAAQLKSIMLTLRDTNNQELFVGGYPCFLLNDVARSGGTASDIKEYLSFDLYRVDWSKSSIFTTGAITSANPLLLMFNVEFVKP